MSGVTSRALPARLTASYTGTVPTVVSSLRISFLIAARSPPVERSIMASAPSSSAHFAFCISSFSSHLAPDVPILTLTLTLNPWPIAKSLCSRLLFAHITALPDATARASFSASKPSAFAAISTFSGMPERHSLMRLCMDINLYPGTINYYQCQLSG